MYLKVFLNKHPNLSKIINKEKGEARRTTTDEECTTADKMFERFVKNLRNTTKINEEIITEKIKSKIYQQFVDQQSIKKKNNNKNNEIMLQITTPPSSDLESATTENVYKNKERCNKTQENSDGNQNEKNISNQKPRLNYVGKRPDYLVKQMFTRHEVFHLLITKNIYTNVIEDKEFILNASEKFKKKYRLVPNVLKEFDVVKQNNNNDNNAYHNEKGEEQNINDINKEVTKNLVVIT